MVPLIVVGVVVVGWALFPWIHPIVKAHIASSKVTHGL